MKRILLTLSIIFAFICTFLPTFAVAPTGLSNRPEAPHWVKNKITVHLPKDDRANSMKKAFNTWTDASDGKLQFSYIESEKMADINVKFTDVVNNSEDPIGSCTLKTSGLEIQKAEINIATKSKQAKKYSRNYIYTVMLHEVGHALGMQNSPRKRTSIMHSPINEDQDILISDKRTLYRNYGWSWIDRRFKD